MGHQISKQQNQQMSDDQRMTNSIETNIDPSTSATTDLQVKISKNTRLFTSNAKKWKKQQQQQPNQRIDVNSSKIKTKAKAKAKTATHIESATNSIVVSEAVTATTAAAAATSNQERNAGSVVITIRLLKMETTRGFDANSVGNELTQIDIYSNNNNNTTSSSSSNSSDSKNNNCNSNDDRNRLSNQFQAGHSSNDAHSLLCNVYMPENSTPIQNSNFKMDNNNVHVKRIEAEVLAVGSGAMAHNNANNGQTNFKKSSHANRALRSDAIICDNVLINCTSQTEQPHQLAAAARDRLAHSLNEMHLAKSTDAVAATVAPTTAITNNQPRQQPATKSLQSTTKTTSAFIPSSLIGTVSPYPHHIPIANIIRSDCFNGLVDTDLSALCQHAKKVCNSCGISGGGGGAAVTSVTKQQNGASKESKELKSKKPNWGIKLNCTKLRGIKSLSSSLSSEPSSPSAPANPTTLNDSVNANAESNTIASNATTITTTTVPAQQPTALLCTSGGNVIIVTTDQQQSWFASDEYSIEDCDKKAHLQRAIEIAEHVEPTPPGFISRSDLQSLHSMSSSNLQLLPRTMASVGNDANGRNAAVPKTPVSSPHWTMVCSNSPALRIMLPSLLQDMTDMSRIHSQVDYVHCLVPDLMQITNCSFYWGKMDRYEAERLLDNKPEGTFLLRDSAQEEFLFSVSFRKYGRSLHARIEQFNHKFSFDCHDSSVYTSRTVTGLLEHYKDPGCVMFFEPALTIPLNRNFVFSLQQLCRATIVSHTTYDGVNEICLPKKLKSYLKEYHYKQHVRVKRFDEPIYGTS